jgi:hypothetical protein
LRTQPKSSHAPVIGHRPDADELAGVLDTILDCEDDLKSASNSRACTRGDARRSHIVLVAVERGDDRDIYMVEPVDAAKRRASCSRARRRRFVRP